MSFPSNYYDLLCSKIPWKVKVTFGVNRNIFAMAIEDPRAVEDFTEEKNPNIFAMAMERPRAAKDFIEVRNPDGR